MSKIHITLVGGQPAPVYHGIVATNPDKIEFICSQNSIDALDKLKDEIHIPTNTNILSPTDPIEISNLAEKLAEKYKNDEITVNISGGLKSWSYFFSIIFSRLPNAAVVYMDQNNVLWNYRTMEGSSDFIFDMHAIFRLYGNPIDNNYRKFSDYTEKDKANLVKIKEIRAFNFVDFNKLTTVLSDKQNNRLKNQLEGSFSLNPNSNSYIEWSKHKGDDINDHIHLCLYNKQNKHKEISFESPNAINLTFHAGWFEYDVAKLLSGWDKVHEICMNCRFPFLSNIDKNETDIIINTGSKILFVECKTQITHITDIDKFRSVVKGYGGTGSKGLFITDVKMSDMAKQKCEENGIISFSLQDEHLGMNTDKALFLLLNQELFNINTK